MRAASPLPEDAKHESGELDAILQKITTATDKIQERAQDIRSGKTPTGAFLMSKQRGAQAAFEEMHDDTLLTESREDIRLEHTSECTDCVECRERSLTQRSVSKKILRRREGA